MTGVYRFSARNLPDGQLAMPGEQLREHAFVIGVEMLDDHKSHLAIRFRLREHVTNGFEATRRGAHADNRNAVRNLLQTSFPCRDYGPCCVSLQ